MRPPRIAAVFALFCLALAAGSPVHVMESKGAHGWIKFWGDGSYHLSGRGTLTIQNLSNQQPEIKGKWGKVSGLPDGAEYWNFEGTVDSLGRGMHVELRGWDLSITSKGRGKAWFRGEGTVTIDGGTPRPWVDHPDKWLKLDFRE